MKNIVSSPYIFFLCFDSIMCINGFEESKFVKEPYIKVKLQIEKKVALTSLHKRKFYLKGSPNYNLMDIFKF